MKVCKIYIREFQQFENIELDFTYPKGHKKAGQPLDKICFIGRNGTGKSTILNLLQENLVDLYEKINPQPLIFKLQIDNDFVYLLKQFPQNIFLFKQEIDNDPNWKDDFFSIHVNDFHQFVSKYAAYVYRNSGTDLIRNKLSFKNNSEDLIVYIPSEGNQNIYSQVNDVPKATLNEALQLFNAFPYSHVISTDTIKDFWQILIYQVKRRENEFLEFQNTDANLDKTVREVQDAFEKNNPKILDQLAVIWNKILNKADLEFDSKNANNPIQLNDNLKAYINIKGTKQRINYSQLSSGIRNFIFKIGHLYSLYFNRKITKGFLLIDEPENNLFPDFLYDLIETYSNIISNTQFFVSTHSPIIAAQFEPYERIILDFNDDGSVNTKRGETPIGDDPNDMLVKDFGIRSLLGKEGVRNWERYIELKTLIPLTDGQEKGKLISEFMEIGNKYNFRGDAIS